jgi:hypothetical protein
VAFSGVFVFDSAFIARLGVSLAYLLALYLGSMAEIYGGVRLVGYLRRRLR